LEVHALRKRAWSISAIARQTGHDRKAVRKCVAGDQKAKSPGPAVTRTGSAHSATTSPHDWSRPASVA